MATHITIPMARLIELETAEHDRDKVCEKYQATWAVSQMELAAAIRAAKGE